MDCDLLVIGSGFGGSTVALRAALAGMRVIVLERGRRMTDETWSEIARGRLPVVQWSPGRRIRRDPAVIEIRTLPGLTAVIGSGVGGLSHHYTSVTVPAADEVFESGWPADWTAGSMRPFHDRVAERLRPAPVPHAFPQTDAMETIGRRLGVPTRRLELALDWRPPRYRADTRDGRRELVTWMRGGGATNKRTLDEAYLRDAEAAGAEIRPRHAVTRIGAMREGYRVEFVRPTRSGMVRGALHSPRVALAAGTINTVRLLLEARDRHRSLPRLSMALGTRFSGNGDYGALFVGPRVPFDERAAPSATAWLDYWSSDRLYLMELGRAPIFRQWVSRIIPPLLRLRDRGGVDAAACAWIIGAFGLGAPDGRLRLTRLGRLACETPPGNGAFEHRVVARLREAADAVGATVLRVPLPLARRHTITVHPLGGCALADSPERGVCDSMGQVFGHPGLYVADGGALPTATGCPPSMTIAAVAERIAASITGR